MDKKEASVTELTPDNIQKAELTMLLIMEETRRDDRKAQAKKLGVPWAEYKQLVRKYRMILRAYRIKNETYEGEFEPRKTGRALTAQEISRAHEMLDKIIKLQLGIKEIK